MKHQQVVVDYAYMLKTSVSCLCLVFAGWMLFKLVAACFWLPGWLKENEKLSQQLDNRFKMLADDTEVQSNATEATSTLDTIEEEQKKEK